MTMKILRHPLSPITRRALVALVAVVSVMAVGTIGMKALTGWTWIDSFYFTAMIATAQGPPNPPPNFLAKVFAAVMAFVSIGVLITSIGTLFGPYLGYLFHKGVMFAEREREREEAKKKTQSTR